MSPADLELAAAPDRSTAEANGAAANGAAPHPPPPAVIEATKAAIGALSADPAVATRLARAATTIRVTFPDAGDRQIILRLDREPIEVIDGTDAACEAGLEISTADLHRFWTGTARPSISIVEGTARYQGPVRKALRVFPILRLGRDTYLSALEDWRSDQRGGRR